MLPTPSRTPKKRHSAVNATARVLNFHQPANPSDMMPSPRQIHKQKRKTTNTMAGFELYEDEPESSAAASIPIYMDPVARVPEVDESEDNPFVGPRRTTRPQRRSRKSAAEAVHDAQIEEAARQEAGVVYVL